MSDRGHASLELALGVGLLLIPAAIGVLAFAPWSEHKVIAEAMAAEAARAAVIELAVSAGNETVAAQAAAGGVEDGGFRVGWCGAVPVSPSAGTCPVVRGGAMTVVVEVWTPLISTPWGSVGGLWVGASHSEPIDLYRSLG